MYSINKISVSLLNSKNNCNYDKTREFKTFTQLLKFLNSNESTEYFYGKGFHVMNSNDELLFNHDNFNSVQYDTKIKMN